MHPYLRGQALEELAESGSLQATLDFLPHPLADPWRAASMLADHGVQGHTQARAILTERHLTEAQLCACLRVLGSEAATAARERLDFRPAPDPPLLQQCIKALSSSEATDIIDQRINNGEAIANTDWWAAITELPSRWQLTTARDLLDRLSQIPPAQRADKLLDALDAARDSAPDGRPTTLENLIHDTALNAPDLGADDRAWFLAAAG